MRIRNNIIMWCIGICTLFLGVFSFNTSSLVKASLNIETITDQSKMNPVNSNGFPAMIYSDPECTKPTGQTLNTSINEWKVNKTAEVYGIGGGYKAFDLGSNQWVKNNDVFFRIEGPTAKDSYGIFEAYCNGRSVQLYSDPQLSKSVGHLNPGISDWAVTGLAFDGPDRGSISRINLGNNQWVSANDVYLIRTSYYLAPGTPLYNRTGTQTGTITNGHYYYKVFGVATIKGQVYVKLGSDDQWAKLSQTSFNI